MCVYIFAVRLEDGGPLEEKAALRQKSRENLVARVELIMVADKLYISRANRCKWSGESYGSNEHEEACFYFTPHEPPEESKRYIIKMLTFQLQSEYADAPGRTNRPIRAFLAVARLRHR